MDIAVDLQKAVKKNIPAVDAVDFAESGRPTGNAVGVSRSVYYIMTSIHGDKKANKL